MTDHPAENLEIEYLLEAILDRYGYDFKNYSQASLKRRVLAALSKFQLKTVEELVHKVDDEPEFFPVLLNHLTVTVTELFRDPHVYQCLRAKVVPYLQTYPELKIWHPGCATGEETYSMAILLLEAGLYSRSLLYGTDINPNSLQIARDGITSASALSVGEENYRAAGGLGKLSDYFTVKYGAAMAISELKQHLVFSDHNLVTDNKFGEMNLILCRNVLIYFNAELQKRVLNLLWDSLMVGGFLCLGSKETVDPKELKGCHVYGKAERIFQKKA